jgi:hypothetical protein
MRNIAAFAIILACGAASAAPVYLDCVTRFDRPIKGAAESFKFGIKIDEANGTITHTESDGSAFNTKGFFSANEISYQNIDPGKTFITAITYQIDRTNLSVARTYSAELSPRGMNRLQDWDQSKSSTTSNGTCEVVNVAKRKI